MYDVAIKPWQELLSVFVHAYLSLATAACSGLAASSSLGYVAASHIDIAVEISCSAIMFTLCRRLLPQASELHLLLDNALLNPCLALCFCMPAFAETHCRIDIDGLLSCGLHLWGGWTDQI